MYKNPKKAKAGEGGAKTKGASAMQPAVSGLDGQGVKIMKADADGASMRNNEAAFLRRKESDVPVDQVSRVEELPLEVKAVFRSFSTGFSGRRMRGSKPRRVRLPKRSRAVKTRRRRVLQKGTKTEMKIVNWMKMKCGRYVDPICKS